MHLPNAIISFLILVLILYLWTNRSKLRSQPAQNTGKNYKVLDRSGYSARAELLGQLDHNLRQVVQYLAHETPDDPNVQRLIKGFQHTELEERDGPHKYTSYTVNKGHKIIFCLTKKNCDSSPEREPTVAECPLVDINTLMFVGLHELAHIMTLTVRESPDHEANSHNAEFWKNYTKLLAVAQQLGLYQYQDYQVIPAEYCGQLIKNTPL